MAKYIDVDRLKAKLDEYYREYQSKYMETRTPYTQGLIDALDLAEQVIDSLQQEQPEVDLDEETIRIEFHTIADKCFNEGIEGWEREKLIARHFYNIGQRSRPKISDSSLEEEIAGMYQSLFGTDVINRKEMIYLDTFEAIARHFAQWGAEHLADARKTWPKDLEEAARKTYPNKEGDLCSLHSALQRAAFIAGAKWQKEQMMKEAISCKVFWHDGPLLDYTQEQQDNVLERIGANLGDKVRIIIVKED